MTDPRNTNEKPAVDPRNTNEEPAVDPRNTNEEPAVDRLHDEAEREQARQQEKRHVPREENNDPPDPFAGSDH